VQASLVGSNKYWEFKTLLYKLHKFNGFLIKLSTFLRKLFITNKNVSELQEGNN